MSPTGVVLSRHDVLLAGIAAPMMLAALVGALLPVGMVVALGAGSVPASGGVGYALFYRPPVGDEAARNEAARDAAARDEATGDER